ncbi:response regulator [Acuticoccus kandeliae]|uniref:response regulator n=1 Tax=Acuticoccus kandeliae TaxID=2073160 RepID=UPI000D3E40E3|nr:response regulator [Acuticoccus kandeliae]
MGRKTSQILIVEDEALIAFDLADLLEDAGYTVHGPFADADQALDALKAFVPTLAILDVNLGEGRTSEKVAAYLTQIGTPIVFVSGYTLAGSEVLRNYPNAQRLPKPWDPQEMLATVDRYAGIDGVPFVN